MPLPRTKTEKIIIQDSLCQMNECFKVKTSVDETFHMVMSLRSHPLFHHTFVVSVTESLLSFLHHRTYTGLLCS